MQPATIAWTITELNNDTPVASGQETVNLNPGTGYHEQNFTIENHKLWQLDDPTLYMLTTTVILKGESSDREETHFGFREFTTHDKKILPQWRKNRSQNCLQRSLLSAFPRISARS
ncbi:hypothetical protein CMK14_07550 [Candidatus Poribacteria bacterium]|nr:hypothetical protein [Candidatus Poribacteria bacterium]